MKHTAMSVAAGVLLFAAVPAIAAHVGPNSSQAGASEPSTVTTPATMHGASQTGQPNQSCGSAAAPNTPGNSASAPGSAFNPSGTAGTKYAGQQPQNSNNTASVSQYDVACAHQP